MEVRQCIAIDLACMHDVFYEEGNSPTQDIDLWMFLRLPEYLSHPTVDYLAWRAQDRQLPRCRLRGLSRPKARSSLLENMLMT